MIQITHEKLVKKARAWLLREHGLVISEMASIGEQADAIGFSKYSTLIECKTSRADFLADLKKYFRRSPEAGMGDARYYFTPPGLIRREELPAGWGLLELHGERIYKVAEAKSVPKDHRAEMGLLVSALRRLDGHGPGVSVKHYIYDSKNRAVVIAAREIQTCPSKKIMAAKRDASPTPEPGHFPATAVPIAGGFPGQYAWAKEGR
jgi:hypothetical protein